MRRSTQAPRRQPADAPAAGLVHLSSMQLCDLPHADAKAALEAGAPVYLAVNPVEFHGPHLSLRNDALLSAGLARDLHERLAQSHSWPFLEAAPIELGVDPCPGQGSQHASFGTVRAAVVEACRALVELGCKRLVLMTFHGSPLHAWALEAGVRAAVRLGAQAISPLNVVLEELLADGVGERFASAFAHVPDAAEREGMMRGLARDFHAGFFETSLALHYAPATVSPSYRELLPCPDVASDRALLAASRAARTLGRHRLSRELQLAADGTGWKKLRPFPGYTGRPHRATAEAGAVFARAIVDRYEALARDVFAGRARSPAPILGWVVPATLGGRIAA